MKAVKVRDNLIMSVGLDPNTEHVVEDERCLLKSPPIPQYKINGNWYAAEHFIVVEEKQQITKELSLIYHHRYSFHPGTGGAYYLKDDITAEVDGEYIVDKDKSVLDPKVFNTETEVLLYLLQQQGVNVKIVHVI